MVASFTQMLISPGSSFLFLIYIFAVSFLLMKSDIGTCHCSLLE